MPPNQLATFSCPNWYGPRVNALAPSRNPFLSRRTRRPVVPIGPPMMATFVRHFSVVLSSLNAPVMYPICPAVRKVLIGWSCAEYVPGAPDGSLL